MKIKWMLHRKLFWQEKNRKFFDFLRVFFSRASAHITGTQRTKREAKNKEDKEPGFRGGNRRRRSAEKTIGFVASGKSAWEREIGCKFFEGQKHSQNLEEKPLTVSAILFWLPGLANLKEGGWIRWLVNCCQVGQLWNYMRRGKLFSNYILK